MAGSYRSVLAVVRIIALGVCVPHVVDSQTTLPPVISSMVSGASFQPGPIAPGEVITFFGIGLGSAGPMTFKPDAAGRIAQTLGSTRVLFNGTTAPLLYASSTRVIAMVPADLATGTSVTVRVENLGVASAPVIARVEPASPGLFTASQDGRDQTAALNQDMSVNSSGNPAAPGSLVSLFVSGAGRTQPPYSDGVITGTSPQLATSSVSATVGGLPAEVIFVGLAPGLVSGVFQVNLRLPAAAPSGNRVFVAVNIAGRSSQAGATIAVAGGLTAIPEAPGGLQVTATAAGADLRWKAANGSIRQVRVERVSSQTGEFAEVASVPATASAWIDPQVQPRSFYNYRLRFETPA